MYLAELLHRAMTNTHAILLPAAASSAGGRFNADVAFACISRSKRDRRLSCFGYSGFQLNATWMSHRGTEYTEKMDAGGGALRCSLCALWLRKRCMHSQTTIDLGLDGRSLFALS